MFIFWHGKVRLTVHQKVHFMDWTFLLAFYNVDLRPDWTGNTEEAWKLSDIMSSAWLNFAKTGNPNVTGKLPEVGTLYSRKRCNHVFRQ